LFHRNLLHRDARRPAATIFGDSASFAFAAGVATSSGADFFGCVFNGDSMADSDFTGAAFARAIAVLAGWGTAGATIFG
jgi:hypothetical protein